MRHKLRKPALFNSSVFELLTDKYLIVRAKKGDREAFGKLYQRHLDSIYRYIFFRVNRDQKNAEDLTETVFFKALDKLDSFDENGLGFRPWIYRIAHNLVVDYYRRYKKHVALGEAIPDENQNVEEKIFREFEIKNTLKAMDSLTGEQREIIIMRFVNGLSNREIAKVLSKKEDAVRSMQYRALTSLRKIVKSYE
jgi:RNA polymerase sigma-70 factor, ECF subfamily